MFDILANEEANENQKELNHDQAQYQAMLNQQGQNLQMQTWKATSYPAQVEMMKQAGLNPALMYGQGGGGGGTTGSQGGGSATGSSAFKRNPMDIIGAMQGKAQIDLVNAETQKKKVETAKLAGIDTAEGQQRILSGLKGMEYTDAEIKQIAVATGKTEQEIINLQKGVEVMDKGMEKTDEEIKQIGALIGKTDEEVKQLIEQHKLTKAQTENVKVDSVLKESQTGLTLAEIDKVKEATKQITQDIENGKIQLKQKDIELKQGEWRIVNDVTRIKIETELAKNGLDIKSKQVMNEALRTIILGAGVMSGISGARPVIGY